jgi:hypothetical protein
VKIQVQSIGIVFEEDYMWHSNHDIDGATTIVAEGYLHFARAVDRLRHAHFGTPFPGGCRMKARLRGEAHRFPRYTLGSGKNRNTARPISAQIGFGSIRVMVSHKKIFRTQRDFNRDQPVGPHSPSPRTHFAREIPQRLR